MKKERLSKLQMAILASCKYVLDYLYPKNKYFYDSKYIRNNWIKGRNVSLEVSRFLRKYENSRSSNSQNGIEQWASSELVFQGA